ACIKLFSAWDDVGPGDCGAATIKVRQSLMAVKPSEFQPLEYPDRELLLDAKGKPITYFWTANGPAPCDMTTLSDGGGSYSGADCTQAGADRYSKFGYFRTVRQTYDPKLGATEVGRKYYANHWNIWQKTIQRDASGKPILDATGQPIRLLPEQREPRQIPYYTNVEFPDDDPALWTSALQVVADWNDAMKRTVAGIRLTAADPTAAVPEAQVVASSAGLPDVFVLKRNSCNVTDVAAFAVAHPDVVKSVQELAQVDPTQVTKATLVSVCSALEAVTQSLPDGDAKKFTWQRNGDLRYSFIYWVDRPQGSDSAPLGYGPSSSDPETGEIVSASAYIYGASLNVYSQFAADSVDLLNGNLATDDLLSGKRITDIMKETAASRQARDEFTPSPEAIAQAGAIAGAGTPPGAMKGLDFKRAVLPRIVKVPTASADLKLAALKGTAVEAELMNEDILAAFVKGYVPGRTKLSDVDPADLAKASPVNWMSASRRLDKRDRFQTLATNGCVLTADFADDAILGTALKLAELSGDNLFKTLRASIFRSVTDHEVGHTMGLRHNFEGSTDALNYGKTYWDIRTNLDKSQWSANSLEEHMYSTVMDYGARFNTDVSGLGRYDYAAIRFVYGQLLDIMPNAFDAGGQLAYDTFVGNYTDIPKMVGGVDKVDETAIMRNAEVDAKLRDGFQNLATNGGSFGIYPERPYRFCDDSFEGNITCKTWDMGANQQEIVNNIIDQYKNYYVFNAYQRGRTTWDINGYLNRLTGRYFNRYGEAFQFYYFYSNYFSGSYVASDLLAASMLALNSLGEVLQTPEPGPHCATDMSPNVLTVSDGVGDGTCHNDAPQPLIKLPDGRPYYLSFSDDYYYRITRAGSLYEKLAALLALTDTTAGLFRIDQSRVQDLYSIGYYRVFKDQIVNLLSGVIRDDPSSYGGYTTTAGVYTPTPIVDPMTYGKAAPPTPPYMLAGVKRVDTPDTKTIQQYALAAALARLDSTWDSSLDFSNYLNISIKGAVDDNDYGADAKVVEFTHPVSHTVYRAAQIDPARPGVGYSLLQDLNGIVGVAGTRGTLPSKYGMIGGQPLPDWQSAKADLDAAQAAGAQNSYSRALQIFTYVDSLLALRVDLLGDIRTFRKAFQN
ncbi:MAG TPA: zinc-dependent metalloprotease, partial [Polyangia bacterium]